MEPDKLSIAWSNNTISDEMTEEHKPQTTVNGTEITKVKALTGVEIPDSIETEVKGNNIKSQDTIETSKAWTWNVIYAILVLAYSVLNLCTTMLIPQHNSIKLPEYW